MNESSAISSKATDFQPTTQNPQNNVAGGLQPNSANLQPVVNINQQAFPQTTTLHVLNSQTGTLAAVTTTDQPPKTNSLGIIWLFVIVVVALIGGLILIAKAAKPAAQSQGLAVDSLPETADQPLKPKKKKAKSRRARRRN